MGSTRLVTYSSKKHTGAPNMSLDGKNAKDRGTESGKIHMPQNLN